MPAVRELTIDVHLTEPGGRGAGGWQRSSASVAARMRSQLLAALSRALNALVELRTLTLVCYVVSAHSLGWQGTRPVLLPRLRLPRLTHLTIRTATNSGKCGSAVPATPAVTVSGAAQPAPAFAVIGLGPQCELPSLEHYGK